MCESPTVSSPRGTVGIRVRDKRGTWSAPDGYGYETELQELLAVQPGLIEGITSEAIAVREFSTGVGPADLVVVHVNGSITLIECKLATKADNRRTIIGHVFDYAARLAEMTPAIFLEQWQRQYGPSLDELFYGRPDNARGTLDANLAAGVFTLVLAVDAINDDLRRIVGYLDSHTSAGVRLLAIELHRAMHGVTEILIPTVDGSESADEEDDRRNGTSRPRWTRADDEPYLREHGDELIADALTAFERELEAIGYRVQGEGFGSTPSYSICGAAAGGGKVVPFSIDCSDRSLGCNFDWVLEAGRSAQEIFLVDLLAAGAPLRAKDIRTLDSGSGPARPCPS